MMSPDLSAYLEGVRPSENPARHDLTLQADARGGGLGELSVLGRRPLNESPPSLLILTAVWGAPAALADLAASGAPTPHPRLAAHLRALGGDAVAWVTAWVMSGAPGRAQLGRALDAARRLLEAEHRVSRCYVVVPRWAAEFNGLPPAALNAFWEGAGFIGDSRNVEADGAPIYIHPGIDAVLT